MQARRLGSYSERYRQKHLLRQDLDFSGECEPVRQLPENPIQSGYVSPLRQFRPGHYHPHSGPHQRQNFLETLSTW